MFLFVVIAMLCLLLTFSIDLIKMLHLSTLLGVFTGSRSSGILHKQLQEAKEKLERVREAAPTTSHYTNTIKTMRAENEVQSLLGKIRSEEHLRRLKGASIDLVAGYLLKAIFSVVLFIITVRNRHMPVMVINESVNMQPLGAVLSFPTGVHNAISVPVWVLTCNSMFRLIYNAIKGKC